MSTPVENSKKKQNPHTETKNKMPFTAKKVSGGIFSMVIKFLISNISFLVSKLQNFWSNVNYIFEESKKRKFTPKSTSKNKRLVKLKGLKNFIVTDGKDDHETKNSTSSYSSDTDSDSYISEDEIYDPNDSYDQWETSSSDSEEESNLNSLYKSNKLDTFNVSDFSNTELSDNSDSENSSSFSSIRKSGTKNNSNKIRKVKLDPSRRFPLDPRINLWDESGLYLETEKPPEQSPENEIYTSPNINDLVLVNLVDLGIFIKSTKSLLINAARAAIRLYAMAFLYENAKSETILKVCYDQMRMEGLCKPGEEPLLWAFLNIFSEEINAAVKEEITLKSLMSTEDNDTVLNLTREHLPKISLGLNMSFLDIKNTILAAKENGVFSNSDIEGDLANALTIYLEQHFSSQPEWYDRDPDERNQKLLSLKLHSKSLSEAFIS